MWSVLDSAGSPVTTDMEVTPNGQGNSKFELLFGTRKKSQALERLDHYCTSHQDEFVVIGCPCHREATGLTRPYRTNQGLFCRATHSECVRASFANALHALIGEDPAVGMLRKGPIGA